MSDLATANPPVTTAFLRGAEVWAPDDSGEELVLVSASYGDLSFESVSQSTRFARGVGLPGRAWVERRPIVMATDDPDFVRGGAAAAADIACAVAVPVFTGASPDEATITGVVVFLCGGDDLAGAIEVWQATGERLELADGYYGSLRDFELEARATSFGLGSGLPGKAWASGMPLLLDDLGDADRFLRPKAAVDANLRIGVGIPVAGDVVMTFLSALDTPLVRWIEIWLPDADGRSLRFAQGYSNEGADLSERYAEARVLPEHGPLGQVFHTGVPLVTDYAGLDGSTWLTAIPVMDGDRCRAVVTLVT